MERISLIIGRERLVEAAWTDHVGDPKGLGRQMHADVHFGAIATLFAWRGTMEAGVLPITANRGTFKVTALDHRTGAFALEPDCRG
jgi:hypothetical protein